MAVGTVHLFNNGPLYLMNGLTGLGWNSTAAGLMHGLLIDNDAIPLDTNDIWSDISSNQVTGTGYTAGGIALESPAVAVASSHYRFDSAIWHSTTASGTTITAKWFIVARRNDTSALIVSTDKLIFWVDLDTTDPATNGTEVSSNAGAFQVDAASSTGWFRIPFQTGEGS